MAQVVQVSTVVTKRDMANAKTTAAGQKTALQAHTLTWLNPDMSWHSPEPPIAISDPDTLVLYQKNYHPFVQALETAYNQHLALRLKPDDVWLVIAQGVATHINAPGNAEAFRSKFVAHEGKKELMVVQDGSPRWDAFVEEICCQAEGFMVDLTLPKALRCDFTTTTPAANIAGRIVMMKALESYFSYGTCCGCGIPAIIMEGTLEDWERILDKVDQIESLDLGLEWWLDELKPVLQQMVNTYKGQPDEDFWSRVITRKSYGSGPTLLSGWVCKFFPYGEDAKTKRNSVAAPMSVGDVPPGLQRVEFTFNGDQTLELQAGYLGCHVDAVEGSVAPHIGWMVMRTDEERDKEKQEAREAWDLLSPEEKESRWELQRAKARPLPTVWQSIGIRSRKVRDRLLRVWDGVTSTKAAK